MNTFYYIGHEEFSFNDNDLVKIYVLDFRNKFVHSIYKTKRKEIFDKINSYKIFDNISNNISFDIKRNGKISLDIK